MRAGVPHNVPYNHEKQLFFVCLHVYILTFQAALHVSFDLLSVRHRHGFRGQDG